MYRNVQQRLETVRYGHKRTENGQKRTERDTTDRNRQSGQKRTETERKRQKQTETDMGGTKEDL